MRWWPYIRNWGVFAILEELEVQRARAGVPDGLPSGTLATLLFVEQSSLRSSVLFREPAVLLQLGWAPIQIHAGSNGWHRHPDGRLEESFHRVLVRRPKKRLYSNTITASTSSRWIKKLETCKTTKPSSH